MTLQSLARTFSRRRFPESKPAPAENRELHELRAENARYKACLNAALIGHFALDADFQIVDSNRAGAEFLGTSKDELLLTRFLQYINATDKEIIAEILSNIADIADCTISTELRISDRLIPVMLQITSITPSTENDYSCHVAMMDLTETKATEDNLRIARDGLHHIANHDPLTRLANRCGFLEQLQQSLKVSGDKNVGVLLLDLDDFKQVNGPLGPKIGDALLRGVADRLLSTVSGVDTVGRLGGDEFAVILKDISSVSELRTVADKISHSLAERYSSAAYDIYVSASIGLSVYPLHSKDAQELLCYADTAMKQAKSHGRNHIQLYTPELNTRLTERYELERDLSIAIRDSQLELYYQPQYDLRSNTISSYEALLRWNHPEKGIVGPQSFIHVAEETGLIEPLGDWILLEACNKLVELRRTNKNITLGVNVSAKQFIKGNLCEKVTAILENTGVPASALELELTESALLQNGEQSLSILRELRSAGVSLAIDDFGTGYSSFSRLQQLPVTKVKIDRSFIQDIPSKPSSCSIVRAIISIAHDLGIEVVAEGVETHQQAVFLSEASCDLLQGYYIGRPNTFRRIRQKATLKNVTRQTAAA